MIFVVDPFTTNSKIFKDNTLTLTAFCAYLSNTVEFF